MKFKKLRKGEYVSDCERFYIKRVCYDYAFGGVQWAVTDRKDGHTDDGFDTFGDAKESAADIIEEEKLDYLMEIKFKNGRLFFHKKTCPLGTFYSVEWVPKGRRKSTCLISDVDFDTALKFANKITSEEITRETN